jgi:tetratricopeptide (TPR) repeat protein
MSQHDGREELPEQGNGTEQPHPGPDRPGTRQSAKPEVAQVQADEQSSVLRRIVVGALKVVGVLGGGVVIYAIGVLLLAIVCLSLYYLFHPSEAKSRWTEHRVESLLREGKSALLEKNDCQLAIGKYTEAIQEVRTDDTTSRVDAIMAYEGRGHGYTELKQYEAASADFDTAVRLAELVEKDVPGAFDFSSLREARDVAHKGKALVERGRVRPAGTVDQPNQTHEPSTVPGDPFQGLEMPERIRVLLATADEALSQEKTDSALAALNEAIALTPDKRGKLMATLYAFRATCNIRRGDKAAALADCETAIRGGCTMASPFYNRAYIIAEKGKYESAIADFNRAMELDNKHAKTYYYRGLVYMKLGLREAADRDFAKAKELDPNVEQKSKLHLDGPSGQP